MTEGQRNYQRRLNAVARARAPWLDLKDVDVKVVVNEATEAGWGGCDTCWYDATPMEIVLRTPTGRHIVTYEDLTVLLQDIVNIEVDK